MRERYGEMIQNQGHIMLNISLNTSNIKVTGETGRLEKYEGEWVMWYEDFDL